MSEYTSALEIARDLDALGFVVGLLLALWMGWIRFGRDCDKRESALLEQIQKLEEDAVEDKADARAEREKNEELFKEYRHEMWRNYSRREPGEARGRDAS